MGFEPTTPTLARLGTSAGKGGEVYLKLNCGPSGLV
jgi:hypothetical protein